MEDVVLNRVIILGRQGVRLAAALLSTPNIGQVPPPPGICPPFMVKLKKKMKFPQH